MGNPVIPTLPQSLAFDPDWIKDPPPWVFRFLDRDPAIRVAMVRMEYQKSTAAAYTKALDQVQAILEKELRRK